MIFKINISQFQKIFVLPIILVHVILLANTKFTLWPEMVVYPYLFNKGFLIYKDIINPYPPLLTLFLAQFAKFFGYMPLPYLILTWGIISFIDLLIFYIAAKITKNYYYASLSTLFFVIFSLPFGINGLWFDLVQTPLILIAFYNFYQFLKNKSSQNLYLAFLLLIVAIFIKQQAVWLMLWFILILVFKTRIKMSNFSKNFYVIVTFFLSILLIHTFLFYSIGTLKDSLFWTIRFPYFMASTMPGYVLLSKFKQLLVILSLFLFFSPTFISPKPKTNFIVLTAFFLILFAYPRFDYFHLIPSIALLSIAFGPAVESYFKKAFFFKLLILAALIYLSVFTVRYFINNWQAQVRFFEPEILTAANFLRQITNENEPVYIQNGPDQLLPLSGRIPVKPWADEFPWYLELQGEQEKIVESLKEQNPRFVVYKPYDIGGRYDLGSYRPEKIAYYLNENYQKSIQISDSLWLMIRK